MNTEKPCLFSIQNKLFWKLVDLYSLSHKDICFIFDINSNEIENYYLTKKLPNSAYVNLLVGYFLNIHRCLRTIFSHNDKCVYSWMSLSRKCFDNMSAINYIVQDKKQIQKRLCEISMRLTQELEK